MSGFKYVHGKRVLYQMPVAWTAPPSRLRPSPAAPLKSNVDVSRKAAVIPIEVVQIEEVQPVEVEMVEQVEMVEMVEQVEQVEQVEMVEPGPVTEPIQRVEEMQAVGEIKPVPVAEPIQPVGEIKPVPLPEANVKIAVEEKVQAVESNGEIPVVETLPVVDPLPEVETLPVIDPPLPEKQAVKAKVKVIKRGRPAKTLDPKKPKAQPIITKKPPIENRAKYAHGLIMTNTPSEWLSLFCEDVLCKVDRYDTVNLEENLSVQNETIPYKLKSLYYGQMNNDFQWIFQVEGSIKIILNENLVLLEEPAVKGTIKIFLKDWVLYAELNGSPVKSIDIPHDKYYSLAKYGHLTCTGTGKFQLCDQYTDIPDTDWAALFKASKLPAHIYKSISIC